MINESKKFELHINVKKTKLMKVNVKNERSVIINEQQLEQVDKFTYLGSVITKDGGAENDIRTRIGKASTAFKSLSNVWKSKNLRTETKIRLFNTNVKSVLLYGAETWKHNRPLVSKLQSFINRCLRRILRIYWPQTISNEELWKTTNQEPIETTIRRRTWRWIGHTLRKKESDITRQALEWNPQGSRKRGRPRETWRRSVHRDLERMGWTWDTVKRDAKNRTRWRSLAEDLCSQRNGKG